MAGANPGTVVTVEVLIEQHVILEVGIGLELLRATVYGTPAAGVPQKNARQAPRQFASHLAQVLSLAGACGKLHGHVAAVVIAIPLQGFDQQIVDWKPDGSSPIRIASEQAKA